MNDAIKQLRQCIIDRQRDGKKLVDPNIPKNSFVRYILVIMLETTALLTLISFIINV